MFAFNRQNLLKKIPYRGPMLLKKMVLTLCVVSSTLCAQDPLLVRTNLDSFEEIITQEEIADRIHELAKEIDVHYQGEEIALVMLMKGAICVASDLMRALETPSTLECVKASSYGANGKKRGELTIHGLERVDVKDKHVLVVDDIYESGATLEGVVEKIAELNPKSIASCILLVKKVPHLTSLYPDFVGFEIEDRFVIGYGLDYKEYWRDLPSIYAVD